VEIADRLDGGGMHRYPLVRLFRNRPEHRYAGAFHEQITPAIAWTIGREFVPDRPSGLVIGHDGYLEGRRTNRSKGERNLELLRRRVEKEPGDPAARYFLARERIPFRGGRAVPGDHLEEALHHLGNLDRDRLSPQLRVDAARLQAAALLAGRRSREALQVLDECPDRGTGCELLRADAEMMIAEYAEALTALGRLDEAR